MKRLINIRPTNLNKYILGILPFVVLLIAYLIASDVRLGINPNDKLMPSLAKIGEAIQRMAFEPSKRTGEYLLWADTVSSLQRLFIGVSLSEIGRASCWERV